MKKLVFLSLFTLALSSCVTVQNRKPCAVADYILNGGICANTRDDQTWDISYDQLVDMLEARPERPDPDHPDQMLPAHAPAVIQTAEDYNEEQTELEQACRKLGPSCSYEVQTLLAKRRQVLERLHIRLKAGP